MVSKHNNNLRHVFFYWCLDEWLSFTQNTYGMSQWAIILVPMITLPFFPSPPPWSPTLTFSSALFLLSPILPPCLYHLSPWNHTSLLDQVKVGQPRELLSKNKQRHVSTLSEGRTKATFTPNLTLRWKRSNSYSFSLPPSPFTWSSCGSRQHGCRWSWARLNFLVTAVCVNRNHSVGHLTPTQHTQWVLVITWDPPPHCTIAAQPCHRAEFGADTARS